MNATTEFVGDYRNCGWETVPVHRPAPDTGTCSCGKADCPNIGKHPVGKHWPKGSADPADFVDRNVGVRLGPDSANLADVDLDCGEAVKVGAVLLPSTDAAFGRGGELTHALYTVPDGKAAYLKLEDPVLPGAEATIVELRWPEWDEDKKQFKALMTVFPPSLHHSGQTLQWVRNGEPGAVAGADLVATVQHIGAAVLIARYAKPKERHALVLLLANLLVRAGWADDKRIVRFMVAVFTAKNDTDKVKKITDGEGIGAVKDARDRLKKNKPMTGFPAIREMLDPAIDERNARKVVAHIAEWLGIPDSSDAGQTAKSHSWELPVPLPEVTPAPPFPIALFPAAVADFWKAKAEALHVPVDYVAGPALAVLGAAVGRSRAAEVKPGYAESPLFWIVNIAPPGATKSASLHGGRAPLDREESRWRKEHADAVQLFDAEMARYEHELKEWKRNPEGAEPPTKPRRPTLRQTVLDDTTAEAAAKVLKDNPRGAVLLKDELIGFGRMLNQYKGGKGNDKTFWLTGWNGKGVGKANRSKDHDAGPLVVIDPFTAVAGMMCPDSLPELREELQRGGPTQDGWCDRFLFQYPEPLDAVEETWAVVPEELEQGYCQVVLDLLGLEMVPIEDPAREKTYRPYFVRFDEAARKAWSAFTREIATRINSLPKTDNYRGVLSKLKHYGLRFACLFHCLDVVSDPETEKSKITASCMERAATVIWYYEGHGRRCLGVGDRSTELARRLLDVLRGWPVIQFNKRDLHRRVRGQSAFRRADLLDAPLVLLTQHGFIAPTDGAVAPGRPAERYAINPLWDRNSGEEPMGPAPQPPPESPPFGTDKPDAAGGVEAAPELASGSFGHVSGVLSMPVQDGENTSKTSDSASFVHIVHIPVEESQISSEGPDSGGDEEGDPWISRNRVRDMDNMDKTRESPRKQGDFASKPPHGQNSPDMDKTPGRSHPGSERRDSSQNIAVIRRPRGRRTPRSAESAPTEVVPGLDHPPIVVTNTGVLGTVTEAVKAWAGPVALDTETTGLDPARDRVRLLQLAVGDDTCLIDLFRFPDPVQALAPLFAALAEKEIIGHNLQFDLRMLAPLGFTPGKVFDTMLASRVLHAGDREANNARLGHGLGEVVERELGLTLDKALQTSDWTGMLTAAQLAYATADVRVLGPLADTLRAELAEANLLDTTMLEMQALPGVAWAKPVTVDRTAWQALAHTAECRQRELAEEMDQLAPNDACLPGAESRNWNSTDDIRSALAGFGITLTSTDDAALAAIDHPLASLLREYRSTAKRVGTYGLNWMTKHVDAEGRVRCSWNQLGAESGRMSCSDPNLQQIPRGSDYRKCLIASPGYVLVKADYSQVELRIAAKVASEQVMIEAYRNRGDLHRLTTARVLSKPESEVTKADRQIAKSLNFGLLYGMGWRSLRGYAQANYGVTLTDQQAQDYRDAFFRAYPGLASWHRRVRRDVQRLFDYDPSGTHEVRTLAGRRRVLSVAKKRADGLPYPNITDALNTPVQGSGADGLKAAIAQLWETRLECPGAVPVIFCHDEIVLEVPEAAATQAAEWLKRCMIEAVAPVLDPVPVEVDVTVGRTWGG